jgi:hypothetical protein
MALRQGNCTIKALRLSRCHVGMKYLQADFATPIANYGILTVDKNIAWGIKLADSGAQTRIWTNQDDDTLRAVSKFRIGCDYVAGNMFSIASPVAGVI